MVSLREDKFVLGRRKKSLSNIKVRLGHRKALRKPCDVLLPNKRDQSSRTLHAWFGRCATQTSVWHQTILPGATSASGVTDQPFDGQFGGPACVLPAHRHKSSVPDDLDPADLARIITISHQITASKF